MLAAARAVGARDLERFTHGTTVATNALLERKGARTAFVATEGFEHLLHLRRQARAHLYRLCDHHPEPLVPLERCFGVAERIGPEGVLRPLDLESLGEIDAEAVAVCLLFSFRDPSHERELAAELRRRLPAARVVASHEVAPEFREYERASTTVIDAFLGPTLAGLSGGPCAEVRRGGASRAPGHALFGRSGDDRRGCRPSSVRAPLRSCSGSRRRGDLRELGGCGERDLPRHGRHVRRRRADQGRRGGARLRTERRRVPGPAAQRRPADGRRGRRLDRVGRRGRRPARRARERGRGARACLLRQGRHAADGDRRQPPARQAS